jgi:nucleotide-binding universal stress UspA family protein
MTRILVPLEHSAGNPRVLQLAAELATARRASLTLLHVYARLSSMIGIVPGATVEGELTAERASGEELLTGARAVLAGIGFSDVDAVLEEHRSIHDAIVATARRFDMIVMGTHGRRGFDRAVLGSIAERVIRDAPCPVVTVHL